MINRIENRYKYAFIVAFSGWILNFLAYLAGVKVMMEAGFFIAVFMGALTIYFTLRLRDQNGGYFTYFQAFKIIFTFGIIYGIGEAIFSCLLYRFIDPDLMIKIQELVIWRMEDSLQKAQNPQQAQAINQIIDLVKTMNFRYEFWMLGLNVIYNIVKYAFYGLLLAFGLKKNLDSFI